MKKINFIRFEFIIFIGIITAFIIYSCSNNASELDETNSITKEITAKSIEFVGIEHNELLEETYIFLKNEKNEKNYQNKSVKSKKKSVENFLLSRIKTNTKYSATSNDLGIKFIKDIFVAKQKSSKRSTYSNKTSTLLSDNEKKYLNMLNNILSEIDLNKNNNIVTSIINLEKVIENDEDLTDEQLITLFSATQTGKYSYQYWTKNMTKWINLKTTNSPISLKQLSHKISSNTESKSKPSGGCKPHHVKNCATCRQHAEDASDLVKADVTGAVGAAAATWVVNAAPGAGQVGYGGAILGGAVGASTVEAVDQFLGWMGW